MSSSSLGKKSNEPHNKGGLSAASNQASIFPSPEGRRTDATQRMMMHSTSSNAGDASPPVLRLDSKKEQRGSSKSPKNDRPNSAVGSVSGSSKKTLPVVSTGSEKLKRSAAVFTDSVRNLLLSVPVTHLLCADASIAIPAVLNLCHSHDMYWYASAY